MGGGAVSIWLWPHRFSITKVFVCQLAEQISSIKCEVRVDWDLDDDGRQQRWVRQPPFPEKVLWGCHVVVGGGVTLKCGVLPKRCYRAPCAGGLCFHYQLSSKLDVGLVHLVWNTCFELACDFKVLEIKTAYWKLTPSFNACLKLDQFLLSSVRETSALWRSMIAVGRVIQWAVILAMVVNVILVVLGIVIQLGRYSNSNTISHDTSTWIQCHTSSTSNTISPVRIIPLISCLNRYLGIAHIYTLHKVLTALQYAC